MTMDPIFQMGKSSLTPENTNREFAPLEAITDNYEKVVLSMDTLLHINRGGIRQKNIVDFLLEK